MANEEDLIGTDLGPYHIVRLLGRGGMGTVYHAVHRKISRHVAIKVLHPARAAGGLIERFVTEARVVNEIRHPNIVDIADIREHGGLHFLVMELLEGITLRSAIQRDAPLAPDRAVRIAVQIADAVDAAHARGVVHRDLKPANVFLTRRGDRDDFAVVMDFGIAKLDGPSALTTGTGELLGTPLYMSPEQAEGAPVDRRTDVYAIGVMIYEMLCGEVPFIADSSAAVLKKIWTEAPVSLKKRRPSLSAELADVTMRAFARDPDARFQSAGDLAQALLATGAIAGTLAVSERRAPRSADLAASSPLAFEETAHSDSLAAPRTSELRHTSTIAGEAAPATRGRRRTRAAVLGAVATVIVAAVAVATYQGTREPSAPMGGGATPSRRAPPARSSPAAAAAATDNTRDAGAREVDAARLDAAPRRRRHRRPNARRLSSRPVHGPPKAAAPASGPRVHQHRTEKEAKPAARSSRSRDPIVPLDERVMGAYLMARRGSEIRGCLRRAARAPYAYLDFFLLPSGASRKVNVQVHGDSPAKVRAAQSCLHAAVRGLLLPRTRRGGMARIWLKSYGKAHGFPRPRELNLRAPPFSQREMAAFVRDRLHKSTARCYALVPPSFADSMQVAVDVSPAGKVLEVKPQRRGSANPKLISCLSEAVQALRLPKSRTGSPRPLIVTFERPKAK